MRGPTPPALTLSDRLRGVLEPLARRHPRSQRLVRRLRIILAAAAGPNNDQIARQSGLHRSTVRPWRTRWLVSAPRRAAAVTAGDDDRLRARSSRVW